MIRYSIQDRRMADEDIYMKRQGFPSLLQSLLKLSSWR
jgi:hypothetical protein